MSQQILVKGFANSSRGLDQPVCLTRMRLFRKQRIGAVVIIGGCGASFTREWVLAVSKINFDRACTVPD